MKQKSKFDRAVASWHNWRNFRVSYGDVDPSTAYANGWMYGYAAALKDAKKQKNKGGGK